METPTFVYNLVSFSRAYIDIWSSRAERDKILTTLTREERAILRKSYKPDSNLGIGKAYRGTFATKEEILKLIEEFPSSLCEGYYEFLLIERQTLGELDGFAGRTDGETWFELNSFKDGVEWADCNYVVIPKPNCFSHTSAFV
jgi:hypothetical protein